MATVPVIVIGFVVNAYMLYDDLRSLTIIAWTMLGFGIVLYVTDRLGMTVRRIEHTTLGDAVVIGLAQVLDEMSAQTPPRITSTEAAAHSQGPTVSSCSAPVPTTRSTSLHVDIVIHVFTLNDMII